MLKIEELQRDPRNSRALNAVLRILVKGVSKEDLEPFYQEAYKEYKNISGKHKRGAKIRSDVRHCLKWLAHQ